MSTFYFSNEVRVFLHTGSAYHEIIVAPGFSYNQASSSENIAASTLPSSNSTSNVAVKKASEKVKTEFEPAQWNFSTFVRPHGTTDAHAILWKYFLDHGNPFTNQLLVGTGHNRDFDFNQGGSQGFFDLYFHYPNNKAYKMSNCVINSVNIELEIGSLTKLAWSGLGTSLDPVDFSVPGTITNATHLASSSGKVINKLSKVAYTGVNFTLSEFTHAITAGSLSLTNGIQAIFYPVLGEVTKPISFVKTMPMATGSFSGYITGTVSETETKKFVKDILEATDPVAEIEFRAGSSTTLNNIHVTIPYAFLSDPTFSPDGVLDFTVSFESLIDGSFATSTSNTAFKVFYS